jgi:hypothetical protein
LESLERREHLFAKVTSATTVDEQWVSRSPLLAGTAREQVCFANVEADWCYIVVCWFVVWLFDRELDGDVKRPRRAVALQSELSRRSVTVYEVVPQPFLNGIDGKRYPEISATTGCGAHHINS